MANYTTADLKELRESTGAGMLDVKKALDEAGGDREKAIDILRTKGLKSAAKREDRTTAQGVVVSAQAQGAAVILELNCETDFVAKSERFVELAQTLAEAALAAGVSSKEQFLASSHEGATVEQYIVEQGVAFGEKIGLGRFARAEGEHIAAYLHRMNPQIPPQLGVLLVAQGAPAPELLHDIAVHAAAMAPRYLSRDEVPADVVERERHVAEQAARAEGKPETVIEKIVQGRLGAFFKETVLVEQPYVKEPKKSVEQVIREAQGPTITQFVRLRVGS